MTYEKWDKQIPIYDLSAEQIVANNARYADEDSYIIYNDDGSVFDLVLAADVGAGGIEVFIGEIEAKAANKHTATDDITAEEALEIIFSRRKLSRAAAVEISEILKGEAK